MVILIAASVVGGALGFVRRPAGGRLWEQREEFGEIDHFGMSGAGSSSAARMAGDGQRSEGDRAKRVTTVFISGTGRALYSIDFNQAVCQGAIPRSGSLQPPFLGPATWKSPLLG